MTLAFLYPLCFLGVLAIAAPLWLHLRRRSETTLLPFSAVQFLDDQPEPRARPWRLRDPLLLLLRVLGLVLLVLAFTWPYWRHEQESVIRESRVYVLDNTLSHQADGRFERAREALTRELRTLPRETQAAVVELTSAPRLIAAWNVTHDEAAQVVEKLEPSVQRGSYLAAFRLAQHLLQTSLGDRRSLYLVSDSQTNQWEEEAMVAPFLGDVDLHLPDVPTDELPNVAVFQPRPQRVFLGDRVRYDCSVRVLRCGAIESAVVAVTINGKELDRRTVKFPPDAEMVQFELQWEGEPDEWLRGEVSIEAAEDRLPADNRCYFGLAPVHEGRAVVLARSPYLRTALSPDVMSGRWVAAFFEEPPWKEQTPPNDADVLLIESHYLSSAAARELVQEYMRRGQGVMLLVDYIGPAVQAFLRDEGLELRSVVNQPPSAAAFRYVYADHPIFQPFRSADFGNLLDVRIHRYRRLVANDALPLAFSQHGDPLLFQLNRPHGGLLVSAFGLDREETNWPLQTTFVPFLDLCLQHIRPRTTLPTDAVPGERSVWSLPEFRHSDDVVLASQSGDELLRIPVRDGRIEFAAPAVPGIYNVSLDGGRTTHHLLQVNSAVEESDLRFAPSEAIVDAWRLPDGAGQPGAADGRATAFEMSRSEILQQNVWWWLLAAGTLALVAEMLWLARQPSRALAVKRVRAD